jgi:hypothetical protein
MDFLQVHPWHRLFWLMAGVVLARLVVLVLVESWK